jgi:hypothetical protein
MGINASIPKRKPSNASTAITPNSTINSTITIWCITHYKGLKRIDFRITTKRKSSNDLVNQMLTGTDARGTHVEVIEYSAPRALLKDSGLPDIRLLEIKGRRENLRLPFPVSRREVFRSEIKGEGIAFYNGVDPSAESGSFAIVGNSDSAEEVPRRSSPTSPIHHHGKNGRRGGHAWV